MLNIKSIKKALTHAGVFHADDVFSAALLKIVNPDIIIERSFVVPENYDGLIFDIGLGKYDHHQGDNECRTNGIPYASFGKLWRDIGPTLVGCKDALNFDTGFVQDLDYADNVGAFSSLSNAIYSFNPVWDDINTSDEQFFKAVDFAEEILKNEFKKIYAKNKAKSMVEQALNESQNGVVILSYCIPWKEVLIGTDAKFVIFPSQRGGYNIQAVPESMTNRTPVVPFPGKWLGKNSDELQRYVPGMTFCHNSNFLAVADTLENAIAVAKKAIEEYDKEDVKIFNMDDF